LELDKGQRKINYYSEGESKDTHHFCRTEKAIIVNGLESNISSNSIDIILPAGSGELFFK